MALTSLLLCGFIVFNVKKRVQLRDGQSEIREATSTSKQAHDFDGLRAQFYLSAARELDSDGHLKVHNKISPEEGKQTQTIINSIKNSS